jgi:predicted transcriptional regulator
MRVTTDWAAAVNALLSSGLTAVQIAETVGVTRAAVYMWASGQRTPEGGSCTVLLSMCNKRSIPLQAKKNPAV